MRIFDAAARVLLSLNDPERLLIVCGSALLSLCSGCAGTTKWLATEPVLHIPSGTPTVPASVSQYLTVRCVTAAKTKFADQPEPKTGEVEKQNSHDRSSKESKCLYMSVDVSKLLGADVEKPQRNAAIDVLLSTSDMNCSTFISRAFANREGLDYTKTWLQDIATAASAGTATVLAPAAAGFSGANLLIGKGIDTFDSTYYAQQTFQAMETAIAGARTEVRARINSNVPLDMDKYSVRQALSDVLEYDDACSIRGGLAKLNASATRTQTQNETLASTVNQAAAADKQKAYQDGKIALQSGLSVSAVSDALSPPAKPNLAPSPTAPQK